MRNTLVDTVKFCFTSKVISQLSVLVDETEPGVEKTLSQSVPLVLNGLLVQVERGTPPVALLNLAREADKADVLSQLSHTQTMSWTELGPNILVNLVREADKADMLAQLSDTSGTNSSERNANLLLDLLGDTYRSTVNEIALAAGIRPTASGTLLQVAASAVLGVLGKFAVENDLTPTEFVQWLQSQKKIIGAEMLPAFRTAELATQFNSLPASRQPAAVPPRIVNAPLRPSREALELPTGMAPRRTNGLVGWQAGALLLLTLGLGYGFGRLNTAAPELPASTVPAMRAARTAAATPAVPQAPMPAATLAPTGSPTDSAGAVPGAAVAPPAAPLPLAVDAPVAASQPAKKPVDKLAEAMVAATATRPTNARPAAEPALGRPAANAANDEPGRNGSAAPASSRSTEAGGASTEARLYRFLATPTMRVDSVNRTKGWMDLDHVSFEPGQTTLTPESSAQLAGIARVLKSFPNAVVKIGGYTDSTGQGSFDLQFSEARARAVMTVLAGQGVRLHRLFAQGYGSKYAVAPNTTAANRAQNRRVSIRVLRK